MPTHFQRIRLEYFIKYWKATESTKKLGMNFQFQAVYCVTHAWWLFHYFSANKASLGAFFVA